MCVLVVFLVLCLTFPSPLQCAPRILWTADCTSLRGPALRRGNGVLISVTSTSPSDAILQAWHPSMYRGAIGDGTITQSQLMFANYPRLARAGVTDFQMILSNAWPGWPTSWPCDYDNCTAWTQLLAQVSAIVEGHYANVTFDVWNEPDGVFWLATYDQYLTAFATAVPILRKLAPSARIAGPSFFVFDPDKLQAWLQYMDERDALPDVLTWHELLIPNGQHIDETVATARALIAPYPRVKAISINEIVPWGEPVYGVPQTCPGPLISYFAAAERTMIESMAHSCWSTNCASGGASDCWTDTMDGMVCHGNQTGVSLRSTYYAYVAYASISGSIMATVPNGNIDGVAGIDTQERTIRVLLGNSDPLGNPPSSPVEIEIVNIPQSWTTLSVVGSHLTFSSFNASKGWEVFYNDKVQNLNQMFMWTVQPLYFNLYGAVFLEITGL